MINSGSLGTLYNHINARLTHKSGIAPLIDSNGNIVTDDFMKADLLNDHFVNVSTHDNGILPTLKKILSDDISIESVYFDSHDIFKIVQSLKVNSAPGPDKIPTILLKNLNRVLCAPLAMLFSLIFQYCAIPSAWKEAIVKPIFKKGASSSPGNYRPISLTCILCKVYETVIKKQLLSYLNSYSLISKQQHGFLSLHSTTTNLLETMNDWTACLDSRLFVKAIYIDFSNDFLTVSVPNCCINCVILV